MNIIGLRKNLWHIKDSQHPKLQLEYFFFSPDFCGASITPKQ